MSLLHDLVQEMAAPGSTGANSIAAVPGSLFDGGIVDGKKKRKGKKTPMFRRIKGLAEGLGVDSGTTDFDASDVISKIDAASKKEGQVDDTTPFGLEDEDGNMVKVYVRNDQSEDFEKQLASMLAGADEDDDDENSSLEIAEVLFKLKDKFDIVDVEWPGIEGDVEEEQEVAGQGATGGGAPEGAGTDPAAMGADGQEGGMADAGGDPGDLGGLEGEPGAEGDEAEMAPDESGAESALNQVIDMMKADAEAKKAEADARAAEARAKEAEYTAQAAAGRVRKEEQVFDMESAEKKKKEQEKDSQQMAKLARFQHEKAQDAEMKLSMEGKENSDPWVTNDDCDMDDEELTLKELSSLIMRNLRHN